jgi:diacylglycerol kinase (ATP)
LKANDTEASTSPRVRNVADKSARAQFVGGFAFAFAGLGYCFRTQINFRVHIAVTVLVVILGLVLGLSWVEWALLATIITLVRAAEMVNTMIESLVDLVTQDYHPLAGIAKDISAGVVLLTAVGAVVVGIFLFLPKLWVLLHL